LNSESRTTHERLLREAMALFARRGYAGTSMSEIAQRVGVRKASLYNYYPSKADLLMDLLRRSLSSWELASRACLEGPGSAEERLGIYLKTAMAFAEANPQAVGIMRLASTQVGGELRPRVQELLAEHEQISRSRVLEFFAEALDKEELEPASAEELTLFLGTFLHGLLISQIFATGDSRGFNDHLPDLWAFFWRGISGRRPQLELER
jgi:AcrR family transcriptional regulator